MSPTPSRTRAYRFRNIPFAAALGIIVIGAMAALGVSTAAAQANEPQTPDEARAQETRFRDLPPQRQAELEKMLTAVVQEELDKQERMEGQARYMRVRVTMDPVTDLIVIDPGIGYLPKGPNTPDLPSGVLEDMMFDIGQTAILLLKDIIYVAGYEFRFDGKSIQHFYPMDAVPSGTISPGRGTAAPISGAAEVMKKVVVSAGHGYRKLYYDGAPPIWSFQRDPYNGVQEDLITPFHALFLETYLLARSGVEVNFARSQSSDIHTTPEGHSGEWWQFAARYYLEEMYPDNPEIWNTKGDQTYTSADEDEDINSRPLFAKHIGADAIISLHTNGSENTAARGTQTYAQNGDTADIVFGDSILCYMKEIIRAQDGYEAFPVDGYTRQANKGENSQFPGTAIIVEVAFHTNVDDALALQDPVFQDAAMKGVEKGYRMYRAGMPCKPFKATSIANVTGPRGTSVPVLVNYEGYPKFAVRADVSITSCPSGSTCTDGSQTIATETASPLTWHFGCGSGGVTTTIGVRTVLTDTDNVATTPVDSTVTCQVTSSSSTTAMAVAAPVAASITANEQ